jgi:predicted lipid-binding transport protein (Tim44 family)
MLGGLLMGSLIGSMLFGGGQASGGPGLLDLLLIGGGLFLVLRFVRARHMAVESPSPGGTISFERGPAREWGSATTTPSGATLAAATE